MLKLALLAVLVATAPVYAQDACAHRAVMPPADKRAEPSVPYSLVMTSRDEIADRCGNSSVPTPIACAFPDATATEALHWTILMWDGLSEAEKACSLIYEKSHLPPNLWESPLAYSPEDYAKWLAYVEAYRVYEKAYLDWEREHGEAYRANR
jgi:hypothetical protein